LHDEFNNVYSFSKYFEGNQIKKDEMGGTGCMHLRDNAYKILVR